ncbi:hypothetical protein BH11MYX4_BH11MYX4_24520 [soil metagenome]
MEQRLAGPLTAKGRIHGPVANNFEIHPTASLGNGGTGILDRGRRFIASGDTVRAVDAPAVAAVTSPGGALDGVLRVADALGGGFVFYTEDAVFYAPRFDAPLTRLGSGSVRSFIIGVKCVFLRMADGTSVLLQLADGAPIAGVPADVVGVRAHPNGFMVGLTRDPSGPPTHLYFTKDARTWKKLAIAGARDNAYADGDALVVMSDDTHGFRIGREGKAVPVVLTPDEAMEKMLIAMVGGVPPEPTKVPDGGALLTEGWIPSSRYDDEWFLIRGGQLYVARGSALRKVGPDVKSDLQCSALELGSQPLALCTQLGALMQVYRLDLDTGARVLEREVKVTQGVATQIGGTGNMYPQTLMIAATCDGRADTGYCVRDVAGDFRTFDAPPQGTKGTVFIFPGEAIYAIPDATGAIEMRRAGTSERVTFRAEVMKPLNATLGVDPGSTRPPDLPFTTSGIVRLPTSIRMFHGPNPFKPAPASPMNHALDLPLDGTGPRILSVPGIIATAGLHALRLDGGKLYESADGWGSWHEVAPPPTGVPADLDGAMCDRRGCLFGAWARVGWDRTAPLPTSTR